MSTDMCLYLYVILRARLDWAETAEMPVLCFSFFFFFFFPRVSGLFYCSFTVVATVHEQ